MVSSPPTSLSGPTGSSSPGSPNWLTQASCARSSAKPCPLERAAEAYASVGHNHRRDKVVLDVRASERRFQPGRLTPLERGRCEPHPRACRRAACQSRPDTSRSASSARPRVLASRLTKACITDPASLKRACPAGPGRPGPAARHDRAGICWRPHCAMPVAAGATGSSSSPSAGLRATGVTARPGAAADHRLRPRSRGPRP